MYELKSGLEAGPQHGELHGTFSVLVVACQFANSLCAVVGVYFRQAFELDAALCTQ